MNQTCKFCGFPVSDNFNYCPNCGKKLKEIPLSTDIRKQIGIYALSIFLPPFGLWPSIRYIKQNDEKAKIIGLIAIILTIVSIAITFNLTMQFISNPLGQGSSQQLHQLQNLGY